MKEIEEEINNLFDATRIPKEDLKKAVQEFLQSNPLEVDLSKVHQKRQAINIHGHGYYILYDVAELPPRISIHFPGLRDHKILQLGSGINLVFSDGERFAGYLSFDGEIYREFFISRKMPKARIDAIIHNGPGIVYLREDLSSKSLQQYLKNLETLKLS